MVKRMLSVNKVLGSIPGTSTREKKKTNNRDDVEKLSLGLLNSETRFLNASAKMPEARGQGCEPPLGAGYLCVSRSAHTLDYPAGTVKPEGLGLRTTLAAAW